MGYSLASENDLDQAVTAARAAFPKWSRVPWEKRQARLRRARELLQEHRRSMAELISAEGGKPPQFADLEVQHAMDVLEFCGE